MSAYVITDIEVTDPAAYEEYKKQSPVSLRQFGGRFIARGGTLEVLEGEWRPNRVVILEFDNVEQARAWWSSSAYAPAKALRQRASRGSLVLVAGVEETTPAAPNRL